MGDNGVACDAATGFDGDEGRRNQQPLDSTGGHAQRMNARIDGQTDKRSDRRIERPTNGGYRVNLSGDVEKMIHGDELDATAVPEEDCESERRQSTEDREQDRESCQEDRRQQKSRERFPDDD